MTDSDPSTGVSYRKGVVETGVGFITGFCALVFLIVPFIVPTWLLTVNAVPEASLLQQVFLFAIVAIVLLISVSGAFFMWVIGSTSILLWILSKIWVMLG